MRPACALLALALLAGCGSLSRSTLVGRQLQPSDADADLSALRGSDPLFPATWLVSASLQETPQAALDILQRGLRFHPGHGHLVWRHVALLAHTGRRAEQIEAARAALAADPPSSLEAELRQFVVEGQLALDDPFSAQQEVLRLGAVSDVQPAAVSVAWAAIALSFEFLAHPDEADEALDHSLELGPRGVSSLQALIAASPERSASGRLLAERARGRHPDHPDLQQFLVVQHMLAGDYAAAEQGLANLPQPLPPRLQPDVQALYARLDLLQDRVEQGLSRLRAQLDRSPGDAAALFVLVECWEKRGQPDAAEMQQRLRAARRQLAFDDPRLAQQIDALLQRLQAPSPDAPPP